MTKEERIQEMVSELRRLSTVWAGTKELISTIRYDNSEDQLFAISHNERLQRRYAETKQIVEILKDEGFELETFGCGWAGHLVAVATSNLIVTLRYDYERYTQEVFGAIDKEIGDTIQRQKEWLFQLNDTEDIESIKRNIDIRNKDRQIVEQANQLLLKDKIISQLKEAQ